MRRLKNGKGTSLASLLFAAILMALFRSGAAFAQASPTPSASPSETPSETPSATPSETPSASPSSAPTPSASNKGLKLFSAIGNATAASATSCVNITCPSEDTCEFVTLSGPITGLGRQGSLLAKGNIAGCFSIDTTQAVPNGNDGTECDPTSGTILVTGRSSSSFTISFGGETCTVPGVAASTFQTMDGGFVVTSSTSNQISRGSGNFSAFMNSSSGDASYTLNGNFSK